METSRHSLNCEIGGLDCHVITTEYRARVHCIHMNTYFLMHLGPCIYLGVSGQYLYTVLNAARYFESFYVSQVLQKTLCPTFHSCL